MRTLARRFASRHVGLSSPSAPGHEVRARTTLSTDFHQTSTSDHREKFLVRSQLTVSQGKRERGMLELDPTASSLSSPEPRSSNRASGHPLPHRRRDPTPHLDCTANPRARFLLPHQDPPPRLYGQCQALPSPPGTRLSTSSAQQPRLVALPRRRTTDHPRSDSTAHGIHGFTKRPGSTVSSPPTVIQESSPRERAPLSRDKSPRYSDRYRPLVPRSSSETRRGRDHSHHRHSSHHRTERSPRARASCSPYEKFRGTDPSKALHSRTSAETHRRRDRPPHHASTRPHASRSPGVRAPLSRDKNYADRHRTLAPRSTPEPHRRHERTHPRPAYRRQASRSPKARTPLSHDKRPLHKEPDELPDSRTPSPPDRELERSIPPSPRRVPGSSLSPRKAVAITPPCATPQTRNTIRYGRKANFTDSPIFTCNIPSLTT